MMNRATIVVLAMALLAVAACSTSTNNNAAADAAAEAPAKTTEEAATEGDAPAAGLPADLDQGLLVAMAQFVKTDEGTKPGPARLEIVTREGGEWKIERLEDPDSNVFHKAFMYDAAGQKGIVTLGGTKAAVKLWNKKDGKWVAQTLWTDEWGGKRDRMRDAEVGKLLADGKPALAVATHDQGVVAVLSPKDGGGFDVKELDKKDDTFVHEIELADLDGDGKPEVFSTPSEPNKLDVEVQKGLVMQYDPRTGEKKVAADLGDRHAKEIWAGDVDGDGKDELYVAVEAKTHKEGKKTVIDEPVEIRRYDAGTDPTKGFAIATLDDRFLRFLTVGDVDGDGKKEMVAAPFKSGIWLLRPSDKPSEVAWQKEQIDTDSSGFEHASILLDLDGDKKDELYVASDNQKELRVYTWNGKGFDKEVIAKRSDDDRYLTWNLMPVPVDVVK